MYSELFNLFGMMISLTGVGYLLSRIGIITKAGRSSITSLVVNVILPCNIIRAFSQQLPDNIWSSFALLLITAAAAQLICTLAAKFCYNKLPVKERTIFQYATVCSNAGFMGNPLAEGVFGETGLLYASIFLIPQRIVMWTAGISYFAGEGSGRRAVFKKVLTHPCIIAVEIGMILMIFRLPLPALISETVDSMSNCCTGLSFLIIGCILSEISLKSIFSWKQLLFAVQRLFILPGVVYVLCMLFCVDSLVTGVAVLLTAMPAGATASLLAAEYHGDEVFAAKCVALTTLLSLITIPLWCAVLL